MAALDGRMTLKSDWRCNATQNVDSTYNVNATLNG